MPTQIKLNLWASQVAFIGSLILAFGSIPTFSYPGGLGFGVYGMAVGLIVAPFFYPVKQLGGMLVLFHGNFYLTGGILIALAIPALIKVPTSMGGMIFSIAAIIYIIAAFRGEAGETYGSLSKPAAARGGGE